MIKIPKLVYIDEDKCVNCHMCISVCPVKYCNDGSGDIPAVNENMCIGCGSCIHNCTHNARYGKDDINEFIEALNNNEKIVAISAPAIASNFENKYLNVNGFLRSIGISAVFDVSFGAELTVLSYLNYIEKNNPETVIAQPCPAIVTYIELYKPQLIKYLAPADSPMMHTIKMIKEFYPQLKNHKILILSPCYAKKREFDEVGMGDFNVTYKSLKNFMDENNIDLDLYPEVDYDNPPAERAVLFSTPGGLLRTAARENPDIIDITRKIEGTHKIYDYLKTLDEVIKKGNAPKLIDCLNCKMGCNGGPGTLNLDKTIDDIEMIIEKRNKQMQERYKKTGFLGDKTKKEIHKVLDTFFKPELFKRTYRNLSQNVILKTPNAEQFADIYISLHKYSEKDMYNCSSCGYNRCEGMVIAIFNGLNKAQNCHYYNQSQLKENIKKDSK